MFWRDIFYFVIEISFRYYFETDPRILVSISWFPRVVIAPSPMRFFFLTSRKGDFLSPRFLMASS